MSELGAPWLTRPVFSLTGDQDWAPQWASESLIALCKEHRVPFHIFRTNPCPAWERAIAEGAATQGWHPNFLSNSSHGQSPAEVVSYMQRQFPGCRTVRSHCFSEDTFAWTALADAGVTADSQFATRYQRGINPLRHWTGMVRLPIFFEDDIFFALEAPQLALDNVRRNLFTPGLKIFNLHPTFVGINAPSRDYYENARTQIFGSTSCAPGLCWSGRGTTDVFVELLREVQAAGHEFVSFGKLAELAANSLD